MATDSSTKKSAAPCEPASANGAAGKAVPEDAPVEDRGEADPVAAAEAHSKNMISM